MPQCRIPLRNQFQRKKERMEREKEKEGREKKRKREKNREKRKKREEKLSLLRQEYLDGSQIAFLRGNSCMTLPRRKHEIF
jgi:hypothetical protein